MWKTFLLGPGGRVARFFLVHDTKTGKKVTNGTQIVPNSHKISQMSVKYSKWPKNISTFSNFKALQNLPKLGFLV
jgi:hypothetical protein